MIINDKYRFAFIHIPKCGGTTVKQQLAPFDDRSALYSGVRCHPDLGRLDYGHIPMPLLKEYFPEDFACVAAYRSFALCRDPIDRFLSALLQRAMQYERERRETIPISRLHDELDKVIEYLSANEKVSDYSHIHFEKQSNFLFVSNEQVVANVFRLDDVESLCMHISELLETEITVETIRNRSLYARNPAIRSMIETVWPVVKHVVPQVLLDHRYKLKKYAYVPSRERLMSVIKSHKVQKFIESYYAKDFEIFHSVANRTVSGPE